MLSGEKWCVMEWIYAGFLLSAGVMIGVAGWKFIVQKVRSRSLLLVAAVPVYQLIMAACFYVCRDRDEMGFSGSGSAFSAGP